ncbi:hypothetical protein O4H66_17310 [Comamonadaceae bacterium G21597-S1]|nr:hypothetical protein [Comamonadaceae bacterium G21597-S1]
MITFTRDWRGYASGSSVASMDPATEAQAVSEGVAVYGGIGNILRSLLDSKQNELGFVGENGEETDFSAVLSDVYVSKRGVFDGGTIPDPRKQVIEKSSTVTNSASSDYLGPSEARRIVVSLDSNTSTSNMTATGGQSIPLFAAAAAAGLRWDEPNRPMRYVTTGAQASGAVVTITEAV